MDFEEEEEKGMLQETYEMVAVAPMKEGMALCLPTYGRSQGGGTTHQ